MVTVFSIGRKESMFLSFGGINEKEVKRKCCLSLRHEKEKKNKQTNSSSIQEKRAKIHLAEE